MSDLCLKTGLQLHVIWATFVLISATLDWHTDRHKQMDGCKYVIGLVIAKAFAKAARVFERLRCAWERENE